MKVAEVEINTKLTVKVNDKEHAAFKEYCKDNGVEMSALVRQWIRDELRKSK